MSLLSGKRSAPARVHDHDQHTPVADFGHARNEVVICRVCGRSLLMGERSVGFFAQDGSGPFDVCELCVPRASRYGLRSRPVSPDELTARRRPRTLRFGRRRKAAAQAPLADLAATPMGSAAVPVALAAFNASEYARTLAGLHKTLGTPRASVVPRSATDREVILTVAWEIVWYQFQIRPDGIEQTSGNYLGDLPLRWQQWNCSVAPTGAVSAPEPQRSVANQQESRSVRLAPLPDEVDR